MKINFDKTTGKNIVEAKVTKSCSMWYRIMHFIP